MTDGKPLQDRQPLHDMIESLRAQLRASMDLADQNEAKIRFDVKSVDLEFKIVATETGGINGGIVLDKMPKRVQSKAKEMLHAIWMAPTRTDGEAAFDAFIEMFEPKNPKAAECLAKDRNCVAWVNGSDSTHGCLSTREHP